MGAGGASAKGTPGVETSPINIDAVFERVFPRGTDGTRHLSKKEASRLSSEEAAEISQLLMAGSKAEGGHAERMAAVDAQLPDRSRAVQVEYRGLGVEVDAAVGDGNTPSLWNAIVDFFELVMLRTRANRKPMQVLRDVSGVLEPGRMTLLLGPPGAGKTVLLKALAGRLESNHHLRTRGLVSYNGHDGSEVDPHRIVGLVGQRDCHIPILRVLETLRFAHDCLTDEADRNDLLGKLLELESVSAGGAAKDSGDSEAGAEGPGDGGASAEGSGDGTAGGDARVGNGDDSSGEEDSEGHLHRAGLGLEGAARPGRKGDASGGRLPGAFGNSAEARFLRLLLLAVAGRLEPQEVSQVMGLTHAANTIVGSAVVRGVSGGERRRVTTAEVLVGPQHVILADEISTGLDSATTFSIMRHLRDTTRALRRTTLVLLLQPAPEVMRLFDDLLLLADGRVLYHGEMSKAMDFFAEVGFLCPPRKDPGGFLQEIATPAGQLAYASDELLRSKGIPAAARSPEVMLRHPPKALLVPVADLAEAFWSSPSWGAPMLASLDGGGFPRESSPPGAIRRGHYAKGTLRLGVRVLRRQLLLTMVRNRSFFIARVIQSLVIALAIGSLFVNLTPGEETWRDMAAVCTVTIMFLAFMGIPQVSMVFSTKDVFFKHRAAGLFPPASYSIAMSFSQIPSSAAESIVFCVIVYWMVGLYQTAGGFFTYLLISFFASNSLAALFRLFAYLSPNMIFANSLSSVVLVCLITLNGFTLIKSDIPGYVIWIYYLSPLSWSIRALCLNEFTSPQWDFPLAGHPDVRSGDFALDSFGMGTNRDYIWGAVGMNAALLMSYTFLGALALALVRESSPKPTLPRELAESDRLLELATLSTVAQEHHIAHRDFVEMQRDGDIAAIHSRLVEGSVEEGDGAASAAAAAEGGTAPVSRSGSVTRHLSQTTRVSDAASPREASALGGSLYGPPRAGGDAGSARDADSRRGSLYEPGRLSQADGVPGRAPTGPPAAVEEAADAPIDFARISLVCNDIEYYVPDPSKGKHPGVVRDSGDKEVDGKLKLLQGVSFFAQPGELVALMGGSGAGKTTLMDVVCGRKTVGLIRGDILVNGHPKEQATWSRVVGYVEQSDIHSARVTVYESLLFSARLRLPRTVSLKLVRAVVSATLEMVELDELAGRIVGEPGGNGLTIEQRKRLSIAVELVANPSVVFMDEPTSGLDARAATIVMKAVRNVADSGRTVMVTIHQPSVELFEAFDTLVLMHRGGRLAYFGELGFESQTLIAYLESYGVEKILPGYNPSTWMLEVTGGSMSTTFKSTELDFPALYESSALRAANVAKAEALVREGLDTEEPLRVGGRFAASFGTQSYWLLRKFLQIYWHSPHYNVVRLVLSFIISVGCGVIFLRMGKVEEGEVLSFGKVQAIVGLSFATTIFLGMFNLVSVQPVVSAERSVFYRERASSYYSTGPYSLAIAVVELPYLLVQAFVVAIPLYYLMSFQHVAWKVLYYLLMMFLTLTVYTFFGQIIVLATPTPMLAQLVGMATNQFWTFFNGFLLPYPQIGRGWKWMNRFSPTTWIIYGISSSQLGNLDNEMIDTEGNVTTVKLFLEEFFDFHYDFLWWCPLILFGYVIGFRIMAVLVVRYVNYLKR